jgi:hypothetical protein
MFEKSQRLNAAMKRVENVYGLKPGEYEALRAAQEGRCAICRRATGKTRRLSVDHDHKLERIDLRGSVRGLLCRPCNDMLGHARDDVQVFIRAARYLLEPPARAVLLALLQTEQTEE